MPLTLGSIIILIGMRHRHQYFYAKQTDTNTHMLHICFVSLLVHIYVEAHAEESLATLPFSCFLRFRLLQIFTAQTDSIIATKKKRIPPTTPAVIALCLTRAGTGNFTSSLLS